MNGTTNATAETVEDSTSATLRSTAYGTGVLPSGRMTMQSGLQRAYEHQLLTHTGHVEWVPHLGIPPATSDLRLSDPLLSVWSEFSWLRQHSPCCDHVVATSFRGESPAAAVTEAEVV